MNEYPYVLSYPSIDRLLDKIKTTGVPAKVDSSWLKSVGFRSGNDSRLLTVLSTLGFVDASKSPSERWRKYRGANSKTVLGEAILDGYSSLYLVYPNAHQRSSEEILNVIRSSTTLADETAKRAVKTFEILAKAASFDSASTPTSEESNSSGDFESASIETLTSPSQSQSHLTVNLNIQLTLPETTDAAVYDAFFRSMKEHLINE